MAKSLVLWGSKIGKVFEDNGLGCGKDEAWVDFVFFGGLAEGGFCQVLGRGKECGRAFARCPP